MNLDNNDIDNDSEVSEPFSVDIFSKQLRYSPPVLVQFAQHLYRGSVYVFIPFFVFLTLAGWAVYVIVHPIKVPLDTTNVTNITVVVFFGVVVPSVLLIAWYRSIPYWFLNGMDRGWRVLKIIAEENGHRFPDDFWHPFRGNEYGLEENTFADELMIDSNTDIEGFIGSDINISYTAPPNLVMDNNPFGFYLDSVYWKLEKCGLRFYGERMNIFVPYRAIQTVKKGWLWCNIILKLDTARTGGWTEICISLGHLPTMRGDRMLRDELYQRIFAMKAVDLIEQLEELDQLEMNESVRLFNGTVKRLS